MFNFIMMKLAARPTGLWEKIIFAFNGGISNYAAAIIVLTLCIKLLLLPLDFLNKYMNKQSTKKQAEMKPELEDIKKKYGANKQILNAKTMEVYKKHNFKIGTTFLLLIVNLAVTLTVFITLFQGLNTMAAYKSAQQYEDLQYAYIQSEYDGEHNLTFEQIQGYVNTINAAGNEEKLAQANARVVNKYAEVKDGFLWIDNVWVADSPFATNTLDYDAYKALARLKDDENAQKPVYDLVMKGVNETQKRVNGYLVIPVLAMALIVAQQLLANKSISFKKRKKSFAPDGTEIKPPKPNYVMMAVLAVIYGFFALKYNSVFALYLVTSSLFATVTQPFCNNIIDYIERKKQRKAEKKTEVSYSRKNLNIK